MTASELREHACKCREVALTIDDPIARNVLLEAAADYLAMASEDTADDASCMPAYQITGAVCRVPSLFR